LIEDGRRCAPQVENENENGCGSPALNEDVRRCAPQFEIEDKVEDEVEEQG